MLILCHVFPDIKSIHLPTQSLGIYYRAKKDKPWARQAERNNERIVFVLKKCSHVHRLRIFLFTY